MNDPTKLAELRAKYPLEDHLFALFSLPISFDIEEPKLDHQRKQLLLLEHPDQQRDQSHHPEEAKNKTAHIHQAYQILKNPILRAEYLAEMYQPANLVIDASISSEVLELSWAWREKLELNRTPHNTKEIQHQVQNMHGQLLKQLQEWWHDFFLAEQMVGNWQVLHKILSSLKLLTKLLQDLHFDLWQTPDPQQH